MNQTAKVLTVIGGIFGVYLICNLLSKKSTSTNEMATYPNPTGASRGLRNNNPGNIRISSTIYNGEITPSGDAAFKQFTSAAYGYRAMFVLLYSYLKNYGLNTIAKMITRYAPSNENNTAGYIAHVAQWSGVDANKTLTPASGADMLKIVAAMSRVENGVAANTADVQAGFNLQNYFIM